MFDNQLQQNITKFKRKHFLNLLIKGLLISVLFFGAVFLISGVLEGYFWFNSSVRLGLLLGSSLILVYTLLRLVIIPLAAVLNLEKNLTDEKAANLIGRHFHEISDRLTNLVQLSQQSANENSLLSAALIQKSSELKKFRFSDAVNFKVNFKYLYYLIALALFIICISFINPSILSDGTSRILKYDKTFLRPVPFSFHLESNPYGFSGEPYELKARIEGNTIPELVYIVDGNTRLPAILSGRNISFKIPTLTKSKKITFEASNFSSPEYTIELYNRPEIQKLEIQINFPEYLNTKNPITSKSGNLTIPEGSKILWTVTSQYAESVFLTTPDSSFIMSHEERGIFAIHQTASESFSYALDLSNAKAQNAKPIEYAVTVIKDQYPEINAVFSLDSISYASVVIMGNIADDYGISGLNLHYKINSDSKYQTKAIPFTRGNNDQNFIYDWSLSGLFLNEEDEVTIYVSVFDNDRINGPKSSNSVRYLYKKPSSSQIEKEIDALSDQSQSALENSLKESELLREQIKNLELKLKNDQKVDWQEEKMLQKVLLNRKKLEDEIEELKKQSNLLNQTRKEFNKQSSDLQKKAQKLQDLINEVLDEETKKLYAELQELLKKEASSEEVLKQLDKIQSNEKNLENELERAIELFKRMKMETLLEQAAEKLNQLGERQEKLGSEEEKGDVSKALEQEKINESFEELNKDIEEAQDINKDLKSPEPIDELDSEREDIQKDLESLENELSLDNQDDNDQKKAKNNPDSDQKMKNAGQKMKILAGKMMQMQASAEMEMMQENMDNLRDILDNLIKLSFEQEDILTQIKQVSQLDPRFIELSQEQLDLTDNIEVIEDSLLALAGRVIQISSFVTRELSSINEHLEKTMFQLRERDKGRATSDQQFAMTSMNNLALLLEDVLEQMQMSMSEAMGKPQKGNKKGQSMPSMSEIQKQLSQQIQDLKKSGKQGRALSEELAKLAAEQSELRQSLEQMNEQLGNQPDPSGKGQGNEEGSKLKEAIKKMEENEVDLVNKRLTQQLIDRQQQILTRMLEAEESMRKQKESAERKGETANQNIGKYPPEIEKYLKAKEKEIELLKTIPLDLEPFYKKEVNDYFRRISLPNE